MPALLEICGACCVTSSRTLSCFVPVDSSKTLRRNDQPAGARGDGHLFGWLVMSHGWA
jgi:hypothetical protein